MFRYYVKYIDEHMQLPFKSSGKYKKVKTKIIFNINIISKKGSKNIIMLVL